MPPTDELDMARLEPPLGVITRSQRTGVRALDIAEAILLFLGRGAANRRLRLRGCEVDAGKCHDG